MSVYSANSTITFKYDYKASSTIVRHPGLEEYMEKYSIHPSQAQEDLHKEVLEHRVGALSSSRTESHFLSWLVETIKAKKVIEVGVFVGATTLAIAKSLPEDGKIVGLDITSEFTAIGQKYWKIEGVDHKVDLRIKPATETMKEMADNESEINSYDLIFVDADKSNYDTYYELALKLLRVGGILAIDNVFWDGRVLNNEDASKDTVAIRDLNIKIHGDKRVAASMLPLADGVTLCRKL